MASLFGSSSFVSHTITRKTHITSCSSSQSPPAQPPSSQQPSGEPPLPATAAQQQKSSSSKSAFSSPTAESTDWIATNLTRRFGLGGGLAWAGFLAVGVLSEQIKTRLEVSQQEANTRDVEKEEEVILPNGIKYYDLRVGGGDSPRPGDLVVINIKGKVEGSDEEFVNTFEGEKKKPLALVMGSKPYTRGICEGVEYILKTMKAGGGKRRVIIPPSLGFGEEGAVLGSGIQIPPSSTLEYLIEVDRVSIAPA